MSDEINDCDIIFELSLSNGFYHAFYIVRIFLSKKRNYLSIPKDAFELSRTLGHYG